MNAESLLISRARFDAVIFDLDGVVTKTARVHAASWKRPFDNYLRERATREGVEFSPFDAREDYLRYVDGKPRYDGVQSFLESRGIALPRGKPEDAAEMETVCGLGNRKNALFLAELKEHGVEPYETTICFIRQLRARGFKTAIISSSKNCATVLEAVGATELFNARVKASSRRASASRGSRRLVFSSKPRGVSGSGRRGRWWSKTRFPAWRRDERADSAASSESIAAAIRPDSRRMARASWWRIFPNSRWERTRGSCRPLSNGSTRSRPAMIGDWPFSSITTARSHRSFRGRRTRCSRRRCARRWRSLRGFAPWRSSAGAIWPTCARSSGWKDSSMPAATALTSRGRVVRSPATARAMIFCRCWRWRRGNCAMLSTAFREVRSNAKNTQSRCITETSRKTGSRCWSRRWIARCVSIPICVICRERKCMTFNRASNGTKERRCCIC